MVNDEIVSWGLFTNEDDFIVKKGQEDYKRAF